MGPDGLGSGAKGKTYLLNGPGPGNKGGPTSQVRTSKNPPQTRPVAIPIWFIKLHSNHNPRM